MRALDKSTEKLLTPLFSEYRQPRANSHKNILRIGTERVKAGQTAEGKVLEVNKLMLTVFSRYENEDGKAIDGPPKDPHLAYRFFSRFPFKKKRATRNSEEKYEVGFTDISLAIINEVWPRSIGGDVQIHSAECNGQCGCFSIEYADVQAEILFLTRWQAELESDKTATRNAKFKADHVIDYGVFVKQNYKLPPSKHQKAAAINGIQSSQLYAMDPGTGKTLSSILVMETLADKKQGEKPFLSLVLCPKNVRENWKREINKFAVMDHKASVIRGSNRNERIAKVIEGCVSFNGEKHCTVIMNYESFVSMQQPLAGIEWDLVVLDESHSIADFRTKRTKAILTLRNNSQRRLALTGTPYKNSITDLYPQLEFLFEGASGTSSLKEFRDLYTDSEQLQSGIKVITGLKNMPMFQERLARHSFMATLEEVLPDLPKKNFDYIECTLSHNQAKVYQQIAGQLYAQMDNKLTGETNSLTVNNILTQLLRLAQITSGFVVWDPELDEDGDVVKDQEVERFDPDNRLEVLVEELKNKKPWQKSQIWCCFVQNIKTIQARMKLEGIDAVTFYGGTSDEDRQIAEDRFNNDPKCTVFIGNPKAGGTGLNLRGYNPDRLKECQWVDEHTNYRHDTNCDHVMFYSYNWSSDARTQAIARAARRGQRVPVRVSVFGVPGSIDSEINGRVEHKIETGMNVTDVKKLLNTLVDSKPAVNGD
jgi:hypothetical protein